MLAMIIQARLEEIIDSTYFQIEKSFLRHHTVQGIVLTGGTARMENLMQLVKFRTGMDARMGYSQIPIQNPSGLDKTTFLTAIGLLSLSLRKENNLQPGRPLKNPQVNLTEDHTHSGNGLLSKIGKKLSQQINIIFEEDSRM